MWTFHVPRCMCEAAACAPLPTCRQNPARHRLQEGGAAGGQGAAARPPAHALLMLVLLAAGRGSKAIALPPEGRAVRADLQGAGLGRRLCKWSGVAWKGRMKHGMHDCAHEHMHGWLPCARLRSACKGRERGRQAAHRTSTL